ncbi:tryptophan-rich sensory protein [bacterium]|jgi:benzodiazapine receptor|nr:tryptophan-rich sensory protein [Candidatus Elulimicrobium humile]
MNTASPDSNWYKSLKQSPLTPPSWVFPIAWTILYALIIVSGIVFLSATTTISAGVRSLGFFYYCAAWVFNISWSQIFFRFQRPDISFVVILAMLAFIALNIHAFYPVSRLAAYLLVPYIIWVSFATYLNGYIVFMNPLRRSG